MLNVRRRVWVPTSSPSIARPPTRAASVTSPPLALALAITESAVTRPPNSRTSRSCARAFARPCPPLVEVVALVPKPRSEPSPDDLAR
jgi:hypothetical protein